MSVGSRDRRRVPIGTLLVLLAIAALAAVGCGGDAREGADKQVPPGGSGARSAEPIPPKPDETIAAAAARLAAAAQTRDCERLRKTSYGGLPTLSETECRDLLTQLRDFRVENSSSFSTAGVVDYTSNAGPGTMAFILARDGSFKWTQRLPRTEGLDVVGSSPEDPRRLDAVASSAVEAFRGERCDELESAARGVSEDPAAAADFCRNQDALRRRLARDPGAQPRLLGANSRLAFYSVLPRPDGPYDTFVLLQDGQRAAFVGDYPIPADRRVSRGSG